MSWHFENLLSNSSKKLFWGLSMSRLISILLNLFVKVCMNWRSYIKHGLIGIWMLMLCTSSHKSSYITNHYFRKPIPPKHSNWLSTTYCHWHH